MTGRGVEEGTLGSYPKDIPRSMVNMLSITIKSHV